MQPASSGTYWHHEMITIGYNTNGFAHHSLLDAIDIIGSIGYQSIAITIDYNSLNPWSHNLESQICQVNARLLKYRLSPMVETGARFLLDPWHKHEPTLISRGKKKREVRIDFLNRAIDIAARINAPAVSIWSGIKPETISRDQAWNMLVSGCRAVAKTALKKNIILAFEPEPGMFIENLSQYAQLKKEVNAENFMLTMDLGHTFITQENVSAAVLCFKDDIINIHLEDMKKDIHDHLFFGEGDMDFASILGAVKNSGYNGQINIELSRNSHDAVNIAGRAYEKIKKYMK